jgi:uncharacterized protein (DUF2235 family)
MNADGWKRGTHKVHLQAIFPRRIERDMCSALNRSAAAQYFPGGALYFSFFSRSAYIETKEHQQSVPE